MHVNQNRWIELRRTIELAELAAHPSLADEFFSKARNAAIGA